MARVNREEREEWWQMMFPRSASVLLFDVWRVQADDSDGGA